MGQGKNKSAMGRLRIIGGAWRSRVLPVIDLPGLRPTTDRVRETLFNWLQNDISGARCLDLFAGSGALGFEAASRGSSFVVMLEVQPKAADSLVKNIQTLKAENIQLIREDAIGWLKSSCSQTDPQHSFDIVFLDPPFDSDYMAQACELLEKQQCLSDEAFIYLEMDSKHSLPKLPASWSIIREKKAGQVSYYLARRNIE